MSRGPSYLFCGDDFTGSSDTLATLARAGLNCRLFLSVQEMRRCPDLDRLDAAGLATANRAAEPSAIAAQVAEFGGLLSSLSPKVVHYKVCSTFDSSPGTGSIGAAVNVLRTLLPGAFVMIFGGQPSLGRFCAFSNLFAKGPGGDVFRLDVHPTMANHPVTPMACSDLREVLSDQGLTGVRGVHWPAYEDGSGGLRQNVEKIRSAGELPLFDILAPTDLALLGALMRESGQVLAIGASSVAQAWTAAGGLSAGSMSPVRPAPDKPVFILAGSRSQATAAQVEGAEGFERVIIYPRDIQADPEGALQATAAVCLKNLALGRHVLAHVTGDMGHTLGRDDIAEFTAELTARIAASGTIGRLGIAGGDTSSLSVQRLGVDGLSYLRDIEPGICLCRLHAADRPVLDGLEVALKGGQMGSPEFFTMLKGSI